MKKIFTIMIIALTINAFAQTPTDGLIGYWPFSGNANDVTGNGNNGTIFGATLTSNRFGIANSAYSFDGVTNMIKIAGLNTSLHLDAFNNSFSVIVWVKSANQVSSARIIEDQDNNLGYPFSIQAASNVVHLVAYDGTNNPDIQIPNVFDNNWHMISLIVNQSTDSIYGYFDNLLTGKQLNTITTGITSDTICIGNRRNQNRGFNGLIDDIRIYDRVLTNNEITSLYNENLCFQTISVTDTLMINANFTGFNPITYQNTIKVFPNPSNDHITIDFGSNYTTMNGYTLKITNSLSQIVYTTPISTQETTVDLSSWTGNGIYFVHLIDEQDNTIDIKKIVLQ